MLPPQPGGLYEVATNCFVPGKSLVIDLPSSCTELSSTLSLMGANGDVDSWISNIYSTNVDVWAGGHIYPPNNIQNVPINPPLPYTPGGTNQVKYTFVSDTQVDIYFNGAYVASLQKPSFQVAYMAFASCTGTTENAYGAFV
jgi:hypothetical protein